MRSLYESKASSGRNGSCGLMSVPSTIFKAWKKAGIKRLEMTYDDVADSLTVVPIKEPLVQVSKPVRRGWFGLDKLRKA